MLQWCIQYHLGPTYSASPRLTCCIAWVAAHALENSNYELDFELYYYYLSRTQHRRFQRTFSNMTQPESSAISTEILTSPPEDLAGLVQLINDVYDVAEDGMWKQKGVRTNPEELRDLIEQKRLIVAISNCNIIGCVKVDRAEEVGEFGMLVVDPSIRSQGVGRILVAAAEDWAINQGYHEMQLELLTPRTWKQASKEFNRAWYNRLGYIPQRTEPFEKEYAHFVPLLATECDFTIWRKPLKSTA
jgi:GNAT superfamily N-acetyltransferase